MNYTKSVEYIHSLLVFGSKPGFQRINKVLELLDNPQDKIKSFHVAGTNGKGSTSVLMQSICSASGLKTGLFISPFVVDFCERIQIDGQFIPEFRLAELVTEIKGITDNLDELFKPTEFEFITAVAFKYFFEEKIDVAVIETGLGGLLDSTNVIKQPLAAVITKIDIDHTDILGDTIEKITLQKCGIIKKKCMVISCGTQKAEVLDIIKESAKQSKSPFYVNCLNEITDANIDINGTSFKLNGNDYSIQLIGIHQLDNAASAITAIQKSSLKISNQQIQVGLKNAKFPARLEVLSQNPVVILDGAHNPNGAKALAQTLQHLKLSKITAIVGMMRDKDVNTSLQIVLPFCENVIAVSVESNPRSMCASELSIIASDYCSNVFSENDYMKAINLAFELSNGNPILVFGSLYLASDIRQLVINRLN